MLLWHLCRVGERLQFIAVVQEAVASLQEGNAALAVCAHGWEAGGAAGELLVPRRMGSREDGSCLGQHGGVPGDSPASGAAAAKGIVWGTVVLPAAAPGWVQLGMGPALPALLPEHGSAPLRAARGMFGWEQL